MRQALCTLAICAAVLPLPCLAEPSDVLRPLIRPDTLPMTAPTAIPALDVSLLGDTGVSSLAPPRRSLDATAALVPDIGRELDALGEEVAIDELNRLARFALEHERPDIFREVMISHYDPHWEGLSDARTALNMIAWLPDTADFLPPRIDAARLAISAGELPQIEAQRLWRDLRARVERVGNPDLLQDLAKAMIASHDTELLLDTVSRFHASDRERLQTLAAILCLEELASEDPIAAQIFLEMERLISSGVPPAALPPEVALAYWKIGQRERAAEIVSLTPDPLQRLHIRFDLLALTPP